MSALVIPSRFGPWWRRASLRNVAKDIAAGLLLPFSLQWRGGHLLWKDGHLVWECTGGCIDCASIIGCSITFSGVTRCCNITGGVNSLGLRDDPNTTTALNLTANPCDFRSPFSALRAYSGTTCSGSMISDTTNSWGIQVVHLGTGWRVEAGFIVTVGVPKWFLASNALPICVSGGSFTIANGMSSCTGSNYGYGGSATVAFTYA
jgi:hypothetical protein